MNLKYIVSDVCCILSNHKLNIFPRKSYLLSREINPTTLATLSSHKMPLFFIRFRDKLPSMLLAIFLSVKQNPYHIPRSVLHTSQIGFILIAKFVQVPVTYQLDHYNNEQNDAVTCQF